MSVRAKEQLVETIIDKIRQLVQAADELSIGPDDPLTNLGIDSRKVMELIVELETTLDVTVDDDELLIENFATVTKIADLLAPKVAARNRP